MITPCPLCKQTLTYDKDWGCWACPTMILLSDKADVATHYSFAPVHNRHIMIVLPYRVMTFPDYSVIGKVNDDGKFYTILDTRKLGMNPIFPKSQKDLLARIKTILVFS